MPTVKKQVQEYQNAQCHQNGFRRSKSILDPQLLNWNVKMIAIGYVIIIRYRFCPRASGDCFSEYDVECRQIQSGSSKFIFSSCTLPALEVTVTLILFTIALAQSYADYKLTYRRSHVSFWLLLFASLVENVLSMQFEGNGRIYISYGWIGDIFNGMFLLRNQWI